MTLGGLVEKTPNEGSLRNRAPLPLIIWLRIMEVELDVIRLERGTRRRRAISTLGLTNREGASPSVWRIFLAISISSPQYGCDYPLDLSISLSGGKETNKDSFSSGERRRKSPALNPRARLRCEGIVA